jgi:hypothetical protein
LICHENETHPLIRWRPDAVVYHIVHIPRRGRMGEAMRHLSATDGSGDHCRDEGRCPVNRILASIIAPLLLIACADTRTTVDKYVGGKPIGAVETHQFLWGKMNLAVAPFGITYMGNLDIGWKQFCNMFSALVAAYVAGDVAKAQEVTKQLESAGATKVQVTSIKAAAANQAEKIKANTTQYGQAVGAGAAPTVGTVTPVTP